MSGESGLPSSCFQEEMSPPEGNLVLLSPCFSLALPEEKQRLKSSVSLECDFAQFSLFLSQTPTESKPEHERELFMFPHASVVCSKAGLVLKGR